MVEVDETRSPTHELFGWSIATRSDHTLLGNGFLLGPDQNPLMYRRNLSAPRLKREKRRKILKYRFISRFNRTRMDRVTWVCCPNSVNYFHWLGETLLKLYFLHLIGWKEPIVIGEHMLDKKWARETVRLFPELNFIVVPYYREIRAKTVFMIQECGSGSGDLRSEDGLKLRNAELLKGMVKFLMESFKTELPDVRCKRIHISRQRDNRKVTNIGEVREVLDRFGFEEFLLQDLSLGTQFDLLSNAEAVFAPHGAGLGNIIFMREGGKVLEVTHQKKYQQDAVFPGLSRSMGLEHYILKSALGGERNDDFYVDPLALEAKLVEMIGEEPSSVAGSQRRAQEGSGPASGCAA